MSNVVVPCDPTIFTARQRSLGKVMFSQVSVIIPTWGLVGIPGAMSFPGVGGYFWYQVPLERGMPGLRSFLGEGGVGMSRRRGVPTPRT